MNEQQLNQLVHELSIKYFNKPFLDKACFNGRLRTTGGRYIPSKRLIELNPKYVEETGEEEVNGILKHELCHYHLHIEGKGYKHGDKEFRDLLKKTNSPRHCNALPSAETKEHLYVCKECGQLYRRTRRVNVKKYRCGKCRGKLEKTS